MSDRAWAPLLKQDRERIEALEARWREYDALYRLDQCSYEAVMASYQDWASAIQSLRQDEFEARQGAKVLYDIGIQP